MGGIKTQVTPRPGVLAELVRTLVALRATSRKKSAHYAKLAANPEATPMERAENKQLAELYARLSQRGRGRDEIEID